MKYSGNSKVYGIRYFNVWFYLFAETEMDDYKINMLGESINTGNLMKMKDIHWWCIRHNIVKVKSFAPRQIQRRLFAALVTLSRKVFRPWHKWF